MRYALRRKGFTLVEIIFSLAILAIALTGIVAALASSITAQDLERQLGLARDAALSRLDAARALEFTTSSTIYSQLEAVYPQNPADRENPPNSFDVEGLAGTGRVILYPSSSGDLVDVQVEIIWTTQRGEHRERVSALIGR